MYTKTFHPIVPIILAGRKMNVLRTARKIRFNKSRKVDVLLDEITFTPKIYVGTYTQAYLTYLRAHLLPQLKQ